MNSFVVILSCLAAVTIANPTQNVLVEFLGNGARRCVSNCGSVNPFEDCPPVNCPPAVRNPTCGEPDCTLPGNRLRLHPTTDPNYFYQCVPNGPVGPLVPQKRPCACGTLFSAVVDETRCVHPSEWIADCPATQPSNPVLNQEYCRVECPDCDGTTASTTTRPPVSTPITVEPPTDGPNTTQGPDTTQGPNTPPPGGNCPCVCFPCIWWPCQPCQNNCPCNNQQQGPQQRPW